MLCGLEHTERHRDFEYYRRVKVEHVRGANSRMSMGKVTGTNEILVEFWKGSNRVGLEWLTSLFNVIFKMTKMHNEWRWSINVFIEQEQRGYPELQEV